VLSAEEELCGVVSSEFYVKRKKEKKKEKEIGHIEMCPYDNQL
jgi:hypothetical protein